MGECRALRITRHASRPPVSAFTLIEIMIVVAIFGIVATMGIPTIYQLRKKEDLRQTVADIVEVCSNARAQAILRGTTVELLIHPQERRLDVATPPPARRTEDGETPLPPETFHQSDPKPRSGMSAQIPEKLVIEMVDVNFVEYKDADEAHVRFHPNGTCDELTIVLRSEKNEFRKISLEVTTSLPMVEKIGSL
jgi:prepilin-type N-terminal cleavage/methylation domain-containing protein